MNDIKQQNNLKNLLFKEGLPNPETLSELRNNPILLIDIGYEYVEQGEYEQAYELFRMGMSIDNTDLDIVNGLGITLCEMGKFEESKQVLEQALKNNPNDAITLANIAGVCWEIEDYDRAIYYYHQALQNDSEIEEIYYNLINLYMDNDMLHIAYITALEFVKAFPDSQDAKDLLNDILINMALCNI
ncbi:MAG TPA: tetratricopeptide repeat protein [Spirochaetota bacterium]|nr:tetratricopeptide repeat protein [Spirochaetota bacterium]HRZ25891.1 tetratricopeptide repeat protein [Spirochaetota bacterium]HSA15003.1 tetratricopeptide repeat protein [Spirochaetota bacterium]